MGDEFTQAQNGNDNPYDQDNTTSLPNWNHLIANQDLFYQAQDSLSYVAFNRSEALRASGLQLMRILRFGGSKPQFQYTSAKIAR
jgi:pullulanase/glycogen debranching enzyme